MTSESTTVVIVGTGDSAHGLAHMYSLYGYTESPTEYQVFATEPVQPETGGMPRELHDTTVEIMDYSEAIKTADILLLCIPAFALDHFVTSRMHEMKERVILVDATNAINLLQMDISQKSRPTAQLCGPNPGVVAKVKQLADFFGFNPRILPQKHFKEMGKSQSRIGSEWRDSMIVMVAIFVFTYLYMLFQMRQRPNFEWPIIITRGSSKSFAWTAVWGFSLSLLPGVVARLRSEFQPKFRTPPRVLLWALGIRKHVGLIALYFLCLHACLMLLLFNSSYFGFMLLDRDEGTHGHSHMQKSEEMSMLFATISTSLFLIIGVTSLPSAAHSLNKTQAFVVFGIVVWVALLFGWLHIFMLTCEGKTGQNMECRGWFHPHSPHSWANEMPPITLMASLLPFLVFFLKLLDLTISYSKRVFWSMKRVFGRGTPFKTHPAVENLKESSEDVEGIDVELNE